MARFTARVPVRAPVQQVWDLLTDWQAHGRWIPLTTVTVLTASGTGVGARFVGRTGAGPLGFDDPMEITAWAPPSGDLPGRCELVKQGRLVLGSASLEVRPDGLGAAGTGSAGGPGAGSLVAWTEEIEIAPVWLTRPLGPLIAAAGRFGFVRALRAMARELES